MMIFLRHYLVSIAALAAYLVVNIGAGALHHHHDGTVGRPGMSLAACGSDVQFQTADQAGDDDDEETCLLCSSLHLAQTAPTKIHAELLIVPSGEAFSAAVIFQPHFLKAATHARSPPAA
jgi:hypothetical protein